jgi:hypothetical protein
MEYFEVIKNSLQGNAVIYNTFRVQGILQSWQNLVSILQSSTMYSGALLD